MGKGNKLKFILIIISIILTLTGVVLFTTIHDNNELKENTVIEIDGATTKTLKAKIDGLYPGKTEDYVISFTGDNIKDYLITLDFNGDNDGTLKNFIEVKIKTVYTNNRSQECRRLHGVRRLKYFIVCLIFFNLL